MDFLCYTYSMDFYRRSFFIFMIIYIFCISFGATICMHVFMFSYVPGCTCACVYVRIRARACVHTCIRVRIRAIIHMLHSPSCQHTEIQAVNTHTHLFCDSPKRLALNPGSRACDVCEYIHINIYGYIHT